METNPHIRVNTAAPVQWITTWLIKSKLTQIIWSDQPVSFGSWRTDFKASKRRLLQYFESREIAKYSLDRFAVFVSSRPASHLSSLQMFYLTILANFYFQLYEFNHNQLHIACPCLRCSFMEWNMGSVIGRGLLAHVPYQQINFPRNEGNLGMFRFRPTLENSMSSKVSKGLNRCKEVTKHTRKIRNLYLRLPPWPLVSHWSQSKQLKKLHIFDRYFTMDGQQCYCSLIDK